MASRARNRFFPPVIETRVFREQMYSIRGILPPCPPRHASVAIASAASADRTTNGRL